SGAVVEQYHQRRAGEQVARRRAKTHFRFLEPSARGDDQAFVEELVADLDRAVEQAAGIASQVEHGAAQRSLVLGDEAFDALAQLAAGLVLELAHAKVGVPGFEQAAARARDANHVAHEGDVDRHALPLVQDVERDGAAERPAQLLDRAFEVVRLHRLAIDAQDGVAGLDARALGWRAVDRRYHAQRAVDLQHLDAEAVVAAAGVLREDADLLLVVVLAVRVLAGGHAAHRRLDLAMAVDAVLLLAFAPLDA